MTKISTLSDQPFSFPSKNVIFGVDIMKFLIPGQNFGIFASPTKGMDTFLFEMSMKWMFTFKNFRNVYWHGKTHSAMTCSSYPDGCDYFFAIYIFVLQVKNAVLRMNGSANLISILQQSFSRQLKMLNLMVLLNVRF